MLESTTYQIVLRGRASARLLRPLIDDFTISHGSEGVTNLTGDIRDSSHLHGVLAHLTSVSAEIISINPHPSGHRPGMSSGQCWGPGCETVAHDR